ncbi:decaprenyl-phosphate phosphoribosyltransferase [Legionella pneumophila]|uniref:decaprenyl-phosphate phosphoribosyltransferase n=1 Tax=Legionella pneumophila TaxID=446 RepID=UPI001374C036|nr:decaprenyl-phosphate phosphoribosyltransferase [Legionella pneumophila]HAT8816393.1 decaprenyl-phosphate phosphoribosyltransferase [Legionella pneumophila subsp. pneumophila]MCZ4806055.1 decaprenyl-phosphate phosphoribosyltransferase [Legionella pneumophila]MDW9180607.1 decaprenyl-phosphate phosphoribosyltransferase [Legionella pneumophila]HAT1824818.1 decaprenyl-phosphate phosphoribosyltransferase [Legionella pneumophila]HAT1865366.1 decaprenyl-phosphate phosphoribosyltransferase [Legionel
MMELANKIIRVSYMDKLYQYLLLLRLSHWSKAIFVMLGFIYTPVPGYLFPALMASLSFCLIASAVYIYNDIQDRTEDSLHPFKCNRPIASEQVTLFDAIIVMLLLMVAGIALGWLISKKLVVILIVYLIINLAYNHVLKLIPVFDVACIALGFMLRVLAGTIGIDLAISAWLTVAATLLSLFIALNKRQLEMQLGLKNSTRKVLRRYNPVFLQRLIVITGIACFITYLFYTVYARAESFFFILTLPFAAIALWRFAWLATQDVENDDPVNIFLSDRLSRINLWCFAILTFMALN